MFDFHEKRKIRTILYSKVSIALIGIMVVALSISTFERFRVERTMAERRAEKEDELTREQARIQELKAEVEQLKNDRGIEEELRNRFDVVKEGERIVVIVDDDQSSSSAQPTEITPPDEQEGESFFEMLKFW